MKNQKYHKVGTVTRQIF